MGCQIYLPYLLPHPSQQYNFSIPHQSKGIFTVILLMGVCLLVTGKSMCQVQRLLAPHYTPQTSKYSLHHQHMNHYKSYCMTSFLYIILGPVFGPLVFRNIATILWSLHPMDILICLTLFLVTTWFHMCYLIWWMKIVENSKKIKQKPLNE